MTTQAVSRGTASVPFSGGALEDPFALDITFIENLPEAEIVLNCSTSDNCGSSCPSACTTSGS